MERAVKLLGWLLWFFDRTVIDGAVNGTGWLTRQSAGQLRKAQTGFVGNYALIMAVGLVAIVAIFYYRVANQVLGAVEERFKRCYL